MNVDLNSTAKVIIWKILNINNMEAKEVGKWKNGGSEFEPGIIVCACYSHDHAIIYNKFEDIVNFMKRR